MAHVIHSINATVSGRCHHLDSVIDDAHHQYAIDLVSSASAMILGRHTFELFDAFWPAAASRQDLPENTLALANALATVPKYVVSGARPLGESRSSDMAGSTWANVRHLSNGNAEPGLAGLAKALHSMQGSAVVFGSPGLAAAMLQSALINEVHVLVQPFVGAEGPSAYAGLPDRVALSLIEARPFPSGAVLLRYRVC